ncbi:MAG: hypothetical protein WBF42_04905, partial [Terracidiphilus sp.]
MGKINTGRVLIAGIAAGIVLDILGFLVDGVWLAPRWAAGMKALGHAGFGSNQVMWFNVLGIITGIVLIWVYAGIRPRFGAGARTAVIAGVAIWIVSVLTPNLSFMWFGGLFSRDLTAMTTAAGLVEVLVAALVGGALYKESVA